MSNNNENITENSNQDDKNVVKKNKSTMFSKMKCIFKSKSLCKKVSSEKETSSENSRHSKVKCFSMFVGLVALLTLVSLVVSKAVVSHYIKSNPKAIVSSIENMQKKEMNDYKKKALNDFLTEVSSKNSMYGSFGKNDSKNKILFFADFNCQYCKKQYDEFKKILKEKGDIKVFIIDLPVIGGVNPVIASNYVMSLKPNKYEYLIDQMFLAKKTLDKSNLISIVKSAGLKTADLSKSFDLLEGVMSGGDKSKAAEAEKNIYIANVKRILSKVSSLPVLDKNNGGVPVLFINGKIIYGYQTAEQIKSNLK